MAQAEHRTVALLVAAGQGNRAGGETPKQYRYLGGKAVIAHAVDALVGVDAVYVVIGVHQEAEARAALGERSVVFATGGATRRMSVLAGLEAIARDGGADRVLIHDCARPFLPPSVIDRLNSALDTAQGAMPVLPVADTLITRDGTVADRDNLARVQTPQAFRFDAILAAHRGWSGATEPTDDAQMLKAWGHDVMLIEGDEALQKLTYPADFAAAEVRLGGARSSRTGMGYDVHRLVEGEELWLGGVLIPHDKGLSGHSDADVAIHALVDAILGALAEGDIGSHFPPSDPQWRGVASSRFLEHARDRVAARGGVIEHVDLTIICEAPKIGPHRDLMRARLAAILQMPVDRISVKATTTERLGFTGRGEGIAAQAIATVNMMGDRT
jgi:2-C-methyl-D-erythritol 4-phosphate cytidylyltransferase/2-C-methyl-D-erythritol 2,4-cyclodiphosphate synthase